MMTLRHCRCSCATAWFRWVVVATVVVVLVCVVPVHGDNNNYGVDVSFPMQHSTLSTHERPFGDSKQIFYEEYMQGCRDYYGNDDSWRCDETETTRLELNLNQPAAMTNYTPTGYQKIQCPKKLFTLLRTFWDANKGRDIQEHWNKGEIYTNHWSSPTYMLDFHRNDLTGGGDELTEQLHEEARSTIENWTSEPLVPSSIYGIRVYKTDAVLSPHVDRPGLISSAIINVDQNVEEPWPLEVIGRDGKSHNITMEPGEMILYESHSLIHGRPFSLKGEYFANVFIHFQPEDASEDEEEEEEYDSEEDDEQEEEEDEQEEEL